MFDVIILWGVLACRGHLKKDREGLVEWLAGTEILVSFAWLQDTRISGLVAGHAEIVGKLAGQKCWVEDGWIFAPGIIFTISHRLHVRGTGAMTVFAAYRRLGERGRIVLSYEAGDWTRPAAMTIDAAGEDDSVESVIAVLVSGRKVPFCGL